MRLLPVFATFLWFSTAAQMMAAEATYQSAGFVELPAAIKLDAVSAVAADSDDNVYVLQRGEPQILVFDNAGKYVRGFGEGLFKVPHGLRFDRDGNLWTTDNGNHVLRKFSRGGRLLQSFGVEGKGVSDEEGFRAPDDLVFDRDGNIYVADSGNGRIVKLSMDGKFLKQWGAKGKGDGQFATAHG